MELLGAYYSPERSETEEFEYSLYSWVALQSTMEFLRCHQQGYVPSLLAATNTVDQMNQVYHAMLEHKQALQELAIAKSQELRACGEECELF